MEKRLYREFTEHLLQDRSVTHNFWIYYKYDDMQIAKPLVADLKSGLNADPNKRIEDVYGMPVRFKIQDVRGWFKLATAFTKKDPHLKMMIVEVYETSGEKTVMAVGKNGNWKMRSYYQYAMERVMIGGLPKNIQFQYAS